MKNVVILLIDALRAKNLSLFGYPRETDKNLKELSKDAVLFRQHFSVTNATVPAITSILTGLYPPSHGVIHQLPYTKEEEKKKAEEIKFWFPSFLKEKGYETICIDWMGMWMSKGFDFYGEKDEDSIPKERTAPFLPVKETMDLAISRIEKSKKPFFLFTHLWDTHFPFPNIEYESKGTEGERIKMLEGIKDEKQREYLKRRIENADLCTLEEMKEKYDLAVKNTDKEIGRLCDFLKEKDMWNDTVFVVLADHGTNITEHGIYFSHSGLFDESIHTPLIMRFPGVGGKEINEFTQHTDIVPTILDYLGLEKGNFDGYSLLNLIQNNVPVREKIVAFDGLCEDVKAVRTKERKLIRAENNFCNLCKGQHHAKDEEYDLIHDPEEGKNIYQESRKRLFENMASHLERQQKEWKSPLIYAGGKYYQSLAEAGIEGMRNTEQRFVDYELGKYLDSQKEVLDIGGNTGFFSIYVSQFAKGCDVVEINPFFCEIGREVARFLARDVRFHPMEFEAFQTDKKYDLVFSFAADEVADGLSTLKFEKYIEKILFLLKDKGLICFESQAEDIFYDKFSPKLEYLKQKFDTVLIKKINSSYPVNVPERIFFIGSKK
jgi:SAM-dependent methyltransferase